MSKLSNDDLKVWAEVTKGVTPLPKKRSENEILKGVTGSLAPMPRSSKMPNIPSPNISNSNKQPIIASATGANAPDGKMSKQMRSGKFSPRMVRDYHGHLASFAFQQFVDSIKNCHASGKRSLLCITGKSGRMNKEFPNWCRHPALNGFILYVCPAHPKDGGSGAWYVILRKQRL